MEYLSVAEKVEMVLIYGECRRNVDHAVALYAERFPARIPAISRASFYRVVKQFKENGAVQPKKRTRRATATCENNEVAVLAAVAVDPHVSSRRLDRDSGVSKTSILRILKRHRFHPYHVSLHQELHGADFENRLEFCQWSQHKIQTSRNFFTSVLFSDESGFTNHGQLNRRNMHFWSVGNPRWLREVEHQRLWTVNVWCGIIGDKLIGPYFIEGNLDGQKYREFLDQHLPILLENVTLQQRLNMWFQHDGCPAHYARISREALDRVFPDRWIGRAGPVSWPARSPDLTPLDFFLWGYIKEKVYAEVPTTPENMKERIRNECRAVRRESLILCHESFLKRIDKCIEVGGHHFEHLLK